jgi:hypothetical protein
VPLPLDQRARAAPLVIVSGGQAGVDRAALDAALEYGVPCTGWCPENRAAADGVIDERYPLHVLPGAGYRARTRQNVIDTDGTLILYFDNVVPGGGTDLTIITCRKVGRPCLALDAASTAPKVAAQAITTFCADHRIRLLNIAGPRAEWSYGRAFAIVSALLQQ